MDQQKIYKLELFHVAEKLLALNQKKLELWTNSVAIHALCNGSGKQKMEIFINALIL